MTIANTAGISEIFSSLQGEGTHMGERHLFVRFEKCNIHCEYCDEIEKIGTEMEVENVFTKIKGMDVEQGPHTFVSLTGGEPLFYSSFLKSLCPMLYREGFQLYLETNGILWKQLEEVLPWIQVIAMDLKPSSVTGERVFYDEHRKFLQIAKVKETFIKIVLSKEIDIKEFRDLCEIVCEVHPETPVILQPISEKDREGHDDLELMRLLEELRYIASGYVPNVRILPRLHKILKIR